MKFIATFFLIYFTTTCYSQQIDKIITVADVERIERVLAADDMQGRRPFTPGIEKAADFIVEEFAKSKLNYFGNLGSYKQTFSMVKTKFVSANAVLDGINVDAKTVVAFTSKPQLTITEKSGYEKAVIKPDSILSKEAFKYINQSTKNYIVFVDTILAKDFARLTRFKRESFKTERSVIFVLTNTVPNTFSIDVKHDITETTLTNIVGVIPGKSKKEEYVVFSAHYDHLGTSKPNKDQDSIYNGANDDAAGTTAVISLANYFAKQKNNERTLIFVAFTAEEIGGYGSRYFSEQLNADKVAAMFNIEMIGTQSKWGANSAFITGYEKSNMGQILQSNLKNSKFKFEPDPYPQQNLFYRSDNATLAALGVPAHTISTSKMDSEKFYHTQDDELETLDMANMTEIIKAIALSSQTIISGKETPTRVEKVK